MLAKLILLFPIITYKSNGLRLMTIGKTAIIHPSTIVEEGAKITANVKIGPFCIIGADIEIGEGTILNSHM